VRVVIADDAALIREGIARLLGDAGLDIVGRAENADQLLRLVRDQRPDIAIVDIRMPPSQSDEGLVAAREIRAFHPETGVLVLSQHLEPRYALQLIEQSPERVGYLLKERVGRTEELIDALNRIDAGECVIDRQVVRELMERKRAHDPLSRLSEREREILELMAEGRSNQGICQTLWLSPKTIETHIRNLFLKLGLNEAPLDNRRVLAVLTLLRTL
jgi:DNA-binding NarL/FixJ family response regulator